MSNLIQKLRNVSGRLEKEAIIKREATDLDLKMFNYAYDKNKVFGLKFGKALNIQPPCEADFELLDALRTRQYTGDLARMKVHQHCIKYGGLIKLICNKDLDCGVSATTINKIYPGAVPVFQVQLAKEVPLKKIKFPVNAEIKYDGVRLILRKEKNCVSFWTRNGKHVPLPFLERIIGLSNLPYSVLDMEITLETGKMVDRTKISGLINSAMKGSKLKPEDEVCMVCHVFDCMSIEAFDTKKVSANYEVRRKTTKDFVYLIDSKHFKLAESEVCRTIKDVHQFYSEVLHLGYEGLILKHDNSPYTFKRSAHWAKMKETKTTDLKCIGTVKGDGKYEGMIGALILEGQVEGKFVHVKVGSGLTDNDRTLGSFDYLDKTIEVKYNTLIQDSKSSQWSLFLPRFVCVRFDK